MGELGGGVRLDVGFDLVPVAGVIPNFFAGGADTQEVKKRAITGKIKMRIKTSKTSQVLFDGVF